MPDISIVGVRLTVEGSEAAVAKIAAVDAAASSMTGSLQGAGGAETTGALSRLVISLENVGGGMDGAGGKASGFHGILKDLDGTLNNVSGSMMRFTAYGLAGATAGFAGLSIAAAAFGVRAASSFQQTQISFETMLGSVAKGDALFKGLQQFNLKTPFGLPDLTSTAQTLLQYGFTGDNVMPVLQTLANVASTAPGGMGSQDLQRQALALGQISASGVVRGQDINQLTQAGFPIIKLLQQITGQTGPQLEKQLQGGGLTLPASSLVDAIANGGGPVLSPYADAARKQSLTGAGQWSNFTDTLRSDMATASLPLLQSLTTMLPQLTTSLDKVMAVALPPLNAFFTSAAQNLPGFVDRSIPAIQGFFDGLQRNGPEIGMFFKDLASLLPDLVHIGEDLIPVVDGLARGFHDLTNLPGGTKLIDGILVSLVAYKAVSGVAGIIFDIAKAYKALAVAEEEEAAASLLPHGPGGGSLKTLLKFAATKAGPAALLATIGGAGIKGVHAVTSDEGHSQRKIIEMNQIAAHQEGALSGVNSWLKEFESQGFGAIPLVGKPIRHAIGADDAGNFHLTPGATVHNTQNNTFHVHDAHDPQKVVQVIDQHLRDNARRAGNPASP